MQEKTNVRHKRSGRLDPHGARAVGGVVSRPRQPEWLGRVVEARTQGDTVNLRTLWRARRPSAYATCVDDEPCGQRSHASTHATDLWAVIARHDKIEHGLSKPKS